MSISISVSTGVSISLSRSVLLLYFLRGFSLLFAEKFSSPKNEHWNPKGQSEEDAGNILGICVIPRVANTL